MILFTESIYTIYLADVKGRARLADCGLSRQLPNGQTTYRTGCAGTKGWMAKETLEGEDFIGHKGSTDIQVIFINGRTTFMKGSTLWTMFKMWWQRISSSGRSMKMQRTDLRMKIV